MTHYVVWHNGQWIGPDIPGLSYGRDGFLLVRGDVEIRLGYCGEQCITLIVHEQSIVKCIAEQSLHHLKIYARSRSSVSLLASSISQCQCIIGREAIVRVIDRSIHGSQRYATTLLHPYSAWQLMGLACQLDHTVTIHIVHRAAHSSSSLCIKGIIDAGRGSTSSLVEMHGAHASSHQRVTYLMTSPEGHAMFQPRFALHTDEIAATHGASIGEIDAEHLLYLESRGLNRQQAVDCIVAGFSQDIIAEWQAGAS